MSDYIAEQLALLTNEGCYPGLHFRGDKWRAHVNLAGNYWADDIFPDLALVEAVRLWVAAGKPMDGAAAMEKRHD